MLPTTFPEVNKIYNKPHAMTDEECMDLPVFQGEDTHGIPVIISCWKFSKEDFEEIQRTGCIYLQIASTVMIPAALYTENPFNP